MTYATINAFPAYEVNHDGQVRRLQKNGEYSYLSPYMVGKHFRVTLMRDNKRHFMLVHRLVLMTHGPVQPIDKPLVLHKDDNPANNTLENLVWGDKRDNSLMMVENGLMCPHSAKVFLTRAEASAIRTRYSEGDTMNNLSDIYGASRWTIANIVYDRVQRLSEAA